MKARAISLRDGKSGMVVAEGTYFKASGHVVIGGSEIPPMGGFVHPPYETMPAEMHRKKTERRAFIIWDVQRIWASDGRFRRRQRFGRNGKICQSGSLKVSYLGATGWRQR